MCYRRRLFPTMPLAFLVSVNVMTKLQRKLLTNMLVGCWQTFQHTAGSQVAKAWLKLRVIALY